MTAVFTEAQFRMAVAAAIRAPSLHNSQPWRFRLRDGAIEVRVDPARRLPASDPTGWAARIACGAAVFNLRIALAAAGTPAQVRLRPDPADPDLAARLVPDKPHPATPTVRSLYDAVGRRHSNRAPFWPAPVPASARMRLADAARTEGAWLEFVIGTAAVGALAEIAHSAQRVLERDPRYQAEAGRLDPDRACLGRRTGRGRRTHRRAAGPAAGAAVRRTDPCSGLGLEAQRAGVAGTGRSPPYGRRPAGGLGRPYSGSDPPPPRPPAGLGVHALPAASRSPAPWARTTPGAVHDRHPATPPAWAPPPAWLAPILIGQLYDVVDPPTQAPEAATSARPTPASATPLRSLRQGVARTLHGRRSAASTAPRPRLFQRD